MFSFSRFELSLLAFFVLGYFVLNLFFFPSFYFSIDEHNYIKNAFLLRDGKIAESDPGFACRAGIFTDVGYVSSQFIGRSIFLVPFTFFGLYGVMLSGLFIHALNFLLIILLLRRFSLSPLFAVLYLVYPVFILTSRGVYAELLVLTCLLVGFYFYIGSKLRDKFLAGFFLGLAIFVRYDAFLALVSFAFGCLFDKVDFKKLKLDFNFIFSFNWKSFFLFILGSLPVLVSLLFFNSIVYSGALNTGYGSGFSLLNSLFSSIVDFDNVIYPVLLLLFYPLLLVSPFLSKKFPFKREYFLLIVSYFLINSAFTEFEAFDFSIEKTFTARLRYLVPLIGLLIIPYSFLLSEFFESLKNFNFFNLLKRNYFLFLALIFSFLLVFSFVAIEKHYNYVVLRYSVFEKIYSIIPENSVVIGSSDDCIYFQKAWSKGRRYYNVDLTQDLAGNPQKISLQDLKGPNTYVLFIGYGYQFERDSPRQKVIEIERAKLLYFIEQNYNELEKVYEISYPDFISIYKWS
ncbi:MAG: hypothetical protein QXD98_03090 [Candidatus Diapherotrites archaeon]